MRFVFLGLIKIYQLTLSRFMGNSCRYYPSCSRYGYEAIRRHGTVKGLGLTVWRVLRCNPFSMGGYDPVPEKHSHNAGVHQH